MKVPLLDLHPPLKDLRDEIVEAVTRVIDSTQYIMGPEIDELVKKTKRALLIPGAGQKLLKSNRNK